MASPAVTVAMSVYNGEPYLAEAIESVLAQTFTDFEFLILDDGSQDASPDTILRFAERDPRIRPILRENRGLIASLNQLIAEARAPLIARMDADDICRPERFARQIAFLAAHPDHGVVGSWSEDIDEHSRSIQRDGSGPDQPTSHEAFLESIEADGPLLCHPAVMYRAEVVRGVGGYHAAYRHCEDLDVWLRLASHTRICALPERLLRYRRTDGQISKRFSVEQTTGAVVSRLAYHERLAGRDDPTTGLERLPPIEQLDTLFGRPGVAAAVRTEVVGHLLYSRHALRGEGMDLVLDHVRQGGSRRGLWRTVVRLLTFGEVARARKLFTTLLAA